MNVTLRITKKVFYFLLALAVIVCVAPASVLAAGAPPAPEAGAVISVKTSSAVVAGCGVTRVEIWANDITNLYGIDVRFTFDPALLDVVDAEPGTAGTQITPLSSFLHADFVVRKVACNVASDTDPLCPSAGVVWYAATQTQPSTPVSGSGPLAAVNFVGDAAGLSTLQIYHSEPVDINGSMIAAATGNGQLTVERPNSPTLSIELDAPITAELSWTAVSGVGQYRLYRDTVPYFDPTDPAFETTTALSFEDIGAVGDPDVNHFYVVKAGCGTGLLSDGSKRVGEFDFELIRGS